MAIENQFLVKVGITIDGIFDNFKETKILPFKIRTRRTDQVPRDNQRLNEFFADSFELAGANIQL
jgi:hypothetical protein